MIFSWKRLINAKNHTQTGEMNEKKRNAFHRRGIQKVPDDQPEDREADQDEGGEKTVHEEGAHWWQAQTKGKTQTQTQAKTISAPIRWGTWLEEEGEDVPSG